MFFFDKLALGRRAAPLGVDDFDRWTIKVSVIARIGEDVHAGEAGAYFGALSAIGTQRAPFGVHLERCGEEDSNFMSLPTRA